LKRAVQEIVSRSLVELVSEKINDFVLDGVLRLPPHVAGDAVGNFQLVAAADGAEGRVDSVLVLEVLFDALDERLNVAAGRVKIVHVGVSGLPLFCHRFGGGRHVRLLPARGHRRSFVESFRHFDVLARNLGGGCAQAGPGSHRWRHEWGHGRAFVLHVL
jgi:hypothetical protein